MLINTNKFVVAFSIATGISWAICTLMVMFWQVVMSSVAANMMHMELDKVELTLTLLGFFIGLLGWLVLAAGYCVRLSVK